MQEESEWSTRRRSDARACLMKPQGKKEEGMGERRGGHRESAPESDGPQPRSCAYGYTIVNTNSGWDLKLLVYEALSY